MRHVPVWTMLPLFLLAACQSTPPAESQSASAANRPSSALGRPCPPRLQDAGQCGVGSIYSFPELANVR